MSEPETKDKIEPLKIEIPAPAEPNVDELINQLPRKEQLMLMKGRSVTQVELHQSLLTEINRELIPHLQGDIKMPKIPGHTQPYELFGELPENHPEHPKNWAADHPGHEYFKKYPERKKYCKAFKKDDAAEPKQDAPAV